MRSGGMQDERRPTKQEIVGALAAALPVTILFFTALSVPLAAAQKLGLSGERLSSWILVAWGLPGLLSVTLSIVYRQPLPLTANIFAIILVSSLADRLGYDQIVAGFVVAGAAVAVVAGLGLTRYFAEWIPAPVVLGLLAGAVLPLVVDVFTAINDAPVLMVSTIAAYLVARRLVAHKVPPILPAVVVGLTVIGVSGEFGSLPAKLSVPVPVLIEPSFSFEAAATVAPILIVLIVLQANVPSIIFMRSQGQGPPSRLNDWVSGVGTAFGSFLGPTALSLSLPVTSIVASQRIGGLGARKIAGIVGGSALILIALFAGIAADLPQLVPVPFLLGLAGLAIFDVFVGALKTIVESPLILGPVFAFVIALSDVVLLGFGSFFWALVVGTLVSLLLERGGLHRQQDEQHR